MALARTVWPAHAARHVDDRRTRGGHGLHLGDCVRVCVRVCASVRVCVRVCVGPHGDQGARPA
jgi:hypothetical protein